MNKAIIIIGVTGFIKNFWRCLSKIFGGVYQKFLEVSEPFFKKVLTRRRQRGLKKRVKSGIMYNEQPGEIDR